MSETEKEKDPNTFEVFVAEEIGTTDKFNPPPEEGEKPSQEEIMKMVLERKVFLADKYVEPHHTVSRFVVEEDLKRVIEDANVMHEMCMVGRGDYNSAYAIAHPQICNEDPLRFYVTSEGQVIINPVIIGHGQAAYQKREGCMSYPGEPMKPIFRYGQVTVEYQTLAIKEEDGKQVGEPYLSPKIKTTYKNVDAEIVQHECAHLNGHDIYEPKASVYHSLHTPEEVKGTAIDTDTHK